MEIELAILSRRGGRSYNEDACGHWHSDDHLCCVVADGAGGHGGGDVASKLAVRHIIGRCAEQPLATPQAIESLIAEVNRQVIAHRDDAEAQKQMHSTVVALFIDLERQRASWGHCGDSRLYAFRGGRIAQRTHDHSLVQSLVDGGLLAPEKMRSHPQRSELLSALGVAPAELQIGVSADDWQLAAGDVFLLCTDGVWEYVDDEPMQQALAAAVSPHAWLAAIEACVLEAAADKPSHDNFSALTVWVGAAAP